MLGRFYLMHMLCVRPETANSSSAHLAIILSSRRCARPGTSKRLDDSDEYLVVELQPVKSRVGIFAPRTASAHECAGRQFE